MPSDEEYAQYAMTFEIKNNTNDTVKEPLFGVRYYDTDGNTLEYSSDIRDLYTECSDDLITTLAKGESNTITYYLAVNKTLGKIYVKTDENEYDSAPTKDDDVFEVEFK